MNIIFQNLYLKNFLSFKEAELHLDQDGYTIVQGQNNNISDLSSSNGSGKSALFDALFWCLTGETIRGGKDVVNKYNSGGTQVQLTFIKDSVQYQVLRTKDDDFYKSTLKIYKDNQDISGKGLRDTEKILQDELPEITGSLLTSVIIFGQGLPHRFSNNTPSGRKEVLENLSKADFMIDDLKSRMSSRKNFLLQQIEENKAKQIEFETKSNMIIDMINKSQTQLDSYNQIDNESIQIEINNLTEMCLSYNKELELNQTKYDELSAQIQKIIKNRDSLQNEWHDKLNELREKYDDVLSPIHTNIIGLEAQIETLKEEKKKLDSVVDVCPTCKQKLPDVHKIDTGYIQEKIEQKLYSLNVNKELLEKYTAEKQDKENDIHLEYQPKYDSLSNQIFEQEDLSFKSAQVISDIKKDLSAAETKIVQLKVKLDTESLIKQDLINQLDQHKKDLANVNDNLLYINNNKEYYNQQYNILQQINAILVRDFRSHLLQNVINYISLRCKYYCKIVFNTELISFCIDGNKLSISYDGKEYELLSGGEKQKLDIIIQLSIRDMLCKYLNFSCNILILDEILDNLDDIGSNKIIDLLSSQLEDVSSVFVISHRNDFTIPCDNKIVVIKGADKISYLL